VEQWGLNQNMTIPRQLALGEVIGQKKAKAPPNPRPAKVVQGGNWT
jgi:hypothetical protein